LAYQPDKADPQDKGVSPLENLRIIALARLVLDNFPHIKAYWPMIGTETAALVVTHYQRLLGYIVPDKIHVLYDGRIVRSGGKELALALSLVENERRAAVLAIKRPTEPAVERYRSPARPSPLRTRPWIQGLGC
jgi:hypothetical protein